MSDVITEEGKKKKTYKDIGCRFQRQRLEGRQGGWETPRKEMLEHVIGTSERLLTSDAFKG